MRLPPEEREAAPWTARPLGDLLPAAVPGRPTIVLVDGRSGSGKTTLAERLAVRVRRSAVVHTDDVAWCHSAFGWADLLRDHVLLPLRLGAEVDWAPPGWGPNGRGGARRVQPGLDLVVVEGVEAARADLAPLGDRTLRVQSDTVTAKARGIERDVEQGRPPAAALAFWDEWMAEELPFLAADRPWVRADLIVAGTPTVPLEPGDVAAGSRLANE